MAKKKGTRDRKKSGSKKKKAGPKKKTEEKEEIVEEPEEEEIPEEPEEDDPELSDAVSEVLGKKADKKKDKKIPKKYKTMLLQWTADGYNVKELEELMETAGVAKIRKKFNEFEASIKETDVIRAELDEMDLTDLKTEVKELYDLLADPNKAEEAKEKFETLKLKKRAAVMKKELSKMVLPSMKDRVSALKQKIDGLEDMDDLQTELDKLKVEYKESYFVDGIVSDVKPTAKSKSQAQPTRVKREARKASPMAVKDIFLLYKDGRFISHHTSRPVSKEQQTQLFADLKTGRNFLRSPKYVPHKLNTIPAQALMEKEDMAELRAWNGDVAALKSSGKYMQALLFACMKLAKGKKT